ncbi:hypothetical protein HAX54_028910, partial [Datura stramonium]|nr:hypothetical protein [Datura stramonium]
SMMFELAKCLYPPTVAGLVPVKLKFIEQHSLAKCQFKCKLRYKALGHYLDPRFTGASWVKIGETPVWCRMSVVYPVFYTAPTTPRCLRRSPPTSLQCSP